MSQLNAQDHELIALATSTIQRLVKLKRHGLATVLLTEDGTMITGINLEGSFGCNDLCAEQVALGKAVSQEAGKIVTVVTVRHPKPGEPNQTLKVANPCGKCRELLLDYAPSANVIIREGNELHKVALEQLMPHRYTK